MIAHNPLSLISLCSCVTKSIHLILTFTTTCFFQITLWWTIAPVWELAPVTKWRWRRTALRCASRVLTSAPKVNQMFEIKTIATTDIVITLQFSISPFIWKCIKLFIELCICIYVWFANNYQYFCKQRRLDVHYMCTVLHCTLDCGLLNAKYRRDSRCL